MTPTRDVRLTAPELELACKLAQLRVRELERRLDRTSYAGKPGMKLAVIAELRECEGLAIAFGHNAAAIRRQQVAGIKSSLERGRYELTKTPRQEV